MCKIKILDASAFINGYKIEDKNNFTVSDISYEIKDLKSQIEFNQAIEEGKLKIENPTENAIKKLENAIKNSGDILRLSEPDKNLIALSIDLKEEYKNITVITDDYTIQNTLKILNIPYKSIITEGINQIYNWKLTCEGCKKTFDENYPYEDCDICGSKIYKKRYKK